MIIEMSDNDSSSTIYNKSSMSLDGATRMLSKQDEQECSQPAAVTKDDFDAQENI